jgi:hypothetical protein
MTTAEYAARSVFSTLMLIAGIVVLLFGVYLAYEAQTITLTAIVDFLVGLVLIVVSKFI